MNITIANTPSSQTFKATKVADTSNTLNKIHTNLQLFRLGNEDKSFLEKLEQKINYKELCSNLDITLTLQERWQRVFNYCVERAKSNENKTYVAVHDDKLCGILTYCQNGRKFELDGICSIPQDSKKVPYVGQTLLYQLFKDSADGNAKSIELKAVTDGPFDVVSKYAKRGFKADTTSDYYTHMRCNKYNIAEQLKSFQAEIAYQPCKSSKINLEQFID